MSAQPQKQLVSSPRDAFSKTRTEWAYNGLRERLVVSHAIQNH